MRDFTLRIYSDLLDALLKKNFEFRTFRDFLVEPVQHFCILRHDVDRLPYHSLSMAQLENQKGIRGTYYFRILPVSFNVTVIEKIHDLGHEIGYHYEDFALDKGVIDKAISSFEKNLDKFRKICPIETICMHGSPLSRYDNHTIWKYIDYREYGILGEPYLDVDYQEVQYLTDTGRRWDGYQYNLRDRISQDSPLIHSRSLKKTTDIVDFIMLEEIANGIMLTIHPQRWTDQMIPWLKELFYQNVKNIFKRILAGRYN